MIQIDAVRMWGIPEFTVTEGLISGGSLPCIWCEHQIEGWEFALIVKEDGHAEAFAMHLKCMPPEVKDARKFALGLAQVQ